ncbi:MAG: twin-arginine translocase subunit TatC [Candidatus Sulfopaludibacter sp.]|nr:twin-arginine translocase subunit TatC [Candidatus Sulfopaludibacter sp.]
MSSSEGTPGAGLPQLGSASGTGPVDAIEKLRRRIGAAGGAPPPPPTGGGEDEDDDGMLRMSFLEHLEELRSRIIRSMIGIGVAFTVSLLFSSTLWNFVRQPARIALTSLGYDPDLYVISPMEGFNIVWFKLPLVCSIFLAFPWVLYQVWAFISPGLYRRERRWAAPFILSSSGLFLLGGCFAYFVVFKYGLTFLLGIEHGNGVKAMVSITEYFDLFVNVMLGVGVVFELPVLIFFLTLLRIVTPGFLIRHSRYAILIIFIIAAVVTPTPDVFNMMLFALPMCGLFYVGIFAGYLLVLNREQRKFPWKMVVTISAGVLLLLAAGIYLAITKGWLKLVPHWPFLIR